MPVRTLLSALLLAPALLAPLAAQGAPQYKVTLLGTGGSHFGHHSISENGIVAGSYWDDVSERRYGYTWRDGVLSTFEAPPHNGVFVRGVNNSGTVLFSAYDGPGSYYHAYTYAAGVVTALPEQDGALSSFGYAINNAGTVVGNGLASPPAVAYATLQAINNNGMATGVDAGGAILTDGTQTVAINPAGWHNINPYGINDAGAVVGVAERDGVQGSRGFLFQDGVMTDIGSSHPMEMIALDVNNLGMVVGNSLGLGAAYLYMNGQVHILNSLIDPAYGLSITAANAINDQGQIAGQACGGPFNGCAPVLLSPVPEPGSWVMLGVGLGLLGLMVRRRHG